MNNPYTLTFGKAPEQYISRLQLTNEILDEFRAEKPSQQVFMITGVRGSGKTVLMTEIGKVLKDEKEWTIIELNPETDLIQSLAAKLYSEASIAKHIKALNISLSLPGVTISADNIPDIIDPEVAISRMLTEIDKAGKRVLILIDEVTNTEAVRKFTGAFQIFLRQDMPVFLLMTGLYENIYELQNEKSLTFLYRAPKCILNPLNRGGMIRNYRDVLGVTEEDARIMAGMTCGYSFAFQVLGYLTFRNKGDYKKAVAELRQYLEEYSYEKMWSELSGKERETVRAIAKTSNGKASDIKENLGVKSADYSVYRSRLIRKGVISGEEHGYVSFTLPYFREFVKDMEET